ncbi:High affinity copper uptake protein 1 [Hondaea fermentalgiana]|uniref:High affinity copper uptake protein 1 n=1 Tax=Hondaea fermentalgiana TaxID=2315210 RepID=A0A2R5GCG7_9STRA|nr:High affinity copper uptake protein 1 [Hondaea fermentalgiana]|eukprot:GBG27408.1 High affinity copper uptake protein 1 [Hondaea fermentalgiana]
MKLAQAAAAAAAALAALADSPLAAGTSASAYANVDGVAGVKIEAFHAAWNVPEVDYFALLEEDQGGAEEEQIRGMRRALAEHGIVAISGVPGIDELRQEAFSLATDCLPNLQDSAHVELDDGTQRLSIGARTVAHAMKDWESPALLASTHPSCVALRGIGRKLRRAVQLAQQMFLARVDQVCQTSEKSIDFFVARATSSGDDGFTSVRDLIDAGSQLEHMHVYSRSQHKSTDEHGGTSAALDLHEDAGLFILFVPAVNFGKSASAADGFTLELASGERVTPVFPRDGNTIVLMIGAAFERLVNPRSRVPLRAMPHELHVSHGSTRAWFGKMFLPPADALYTAENQTFASVHAAQIDAVRAQPAKTASMGCTDVFAYATDQSSGCKNDELYCWMKCMPKPTCDTHKQARCVHPNGDPWDVTTHCTECKPRCVAEHHNHTVQGNDFCNGQGTVMFMERIVGWADQDEACVVLLFQVFTLDTRLKFVVGMIAVFAFGIATEFLGLARRNVEKRERSKPFSITGTLLRGCMHFTQLAFAYVAMLFAMTYSLPIMTSIVAGLTTGHVLFNMRQPVSEHIEPCCAITCDETASTSSSEAGNSTTLSDPLLTENRHQC